MFLYQVNGITDDSETSLCSLPSTSGSMHSDHSNPSTNRSRSNMSSHSTVVEVSLYAESFVIKPFMLLLMLPLLVCLAQYLPIYEWPGNVMYPLICASIQYKL